MFYFLSFLCMAVIGSYFFTGGLRYDQMIYGRYNELFIPFLAYLGLSELAEHDPGFKRISLIIVLMGICASSMTLYTRFYSINEYVPYFVSGIDWMFGISLPTAGNVYELPFFISSAGLIILWLFLRKTPSKQICLVATCICYIAICFFNTWKNVYRFQKIDGSDLLLEREIESLMDEGRNLIFVNSPYSSYINLIQFWLWDEPVHIVDDYIEWRETRNSDDLILIYQNNEFATQISEYYPNSISSEHFILNYTDTLCPKK
ncbi:MAG: hypothetical protein K5770_06030 [Lachnospiraceae bacterium]|nr:hypothetical protein [Lachnospiraceae bacterium]